MSKNKLRTDYICRVRFRNTLPPVPFPPKLLTIPSDLERHIHYRPTSLENQTPYSLETDKKLDLDSMEKIILEHLDAQEEDPNACVEVDLPEEDHVFLLSPPQSHSSKSIHKPNVNWLRRVDVTTSEPRIQAAQRPMRPGQPAASQSILPEAYMTHEGRMQGIENTFVRHDDLLQHPKTKARAKRILPVLPDMSCWGNVYTIGQFDSDPCDKARQRKRDSKSIPNQGPSGSKRGRPSEEDATDRGIVRPISNPHDPKDKYLIWFLPDETSSARLVKQKKMDEPIGNEPLTFEAVREYTYSNENDAGTYLLLTMRNDSDGGPGYYYNLVKSKMTTRKKRASNKYQNTDDYEKPNVLSVTYSDAMEFDNGQVTDEEESV